MKFSKNITYKMKNWFHNLCNAVFHYDASILSKLYYIANRDKSKISFFTFIIILFISCGPSTVITGSWKNPELVSKKYSRILVAALTSNTIAKETVENEMALALGKDVSVLKSISEFPPDMHNTDSDKDTIFNRVKNKNIDAILTISLITKETDSRYIPGLYPYNPIVGYNYYENFWGYYNYWYPYYYSPGYYIQDKIYYIETNLYDAHTEKLVWSAQSKTYNPAGLENFSKEFATLIVEKMKKDGILNQEKLSSKSSIKY